MKAFEIAIVEQCRILLQLEGLIDESLLKTSYRRLIRQWHPDLYYSQPLKYKEATEIVKHINVAYEYLSEFLEHNGGTYQNLPCTDTQSSRTWTGVQPRRTYEGKTYSVGYPDDMVTEIFVKSSHIISIGYNRLKRILFIKFTGNRIYRYYEVPEQIAQEFLEASSHGKYAHQYIYPQYRYEAC